MRLRKDKMLAFFAWIRDMSQQLKEDNMAVYAAQASFFVIISVMPFLSLLVSILSFFIPTDIQGFFDDYALPEEIVALAGSLLEDLRTAPKISLLSFSAIFTLWTASKGVGAIRRGIEIAYRVETRHGFFYEKLHSLASTLLFIVLILATVVVLLFGEFLLNLLNIPGLTAFIMQWRILFFILFMCIIFTSIYASTAKQGSTVKSNILYHLPGALFASVGWILFSFFTPCTSSISRTLPIFTAVLPPSA